MQGKGWDKEKNRLLEVYSGPFSSKVFVFKAMVEQNKAYSAMDKKFGELIARGVLEGACRLLQIADWLAYI